MRFALVSSFVVATAVLTVAPTSSHAALSPASVTVVETSAFGDRARVPQSPALLVADKCGECKKCAYDKSGNGTWEKCFDWSMKDCESTGDKYAWCGPKPSPTTTPSTPAPSPTSKKCWYCKTACAKDQGNGRWDYCFTGITQKMCDALGSDHHWCGAQETTPAPRPKPTPAPSMDPCWNCKECSFDKNWDGKWSFCWQKVTKEQCSLFGKRDDDYHWCGK